MFTVTEYVDGMMLYACGYSEKHFRCPFCNSMQMHVAEELSLCTECFKELLDAEALLERPEYRIGYHFDYVKDSG